MEWGIATHAANQIWTEIGEGKFVGREVVDGITTLTVETKGVNRKNLASDAVKLCQLSEGMSAHSDKFGEVIMGHIKSVSGNTVVISIPYAIKISGAANAFQKFLNIP